MTAAVAAPLDDHVLQLGVGDVDEVLSGRAHVVATDHAHRYRGEISLLRDRTRVGIALLIHIHRAGPGCSCDPVGTGNYHWVLTAVMAA